jgi:hypothetical protein
MIDKDKKKFWNMVNVAMELTNRPPLSKEAIVIWYAQLERYDFDVVSAAMDRWLKESTKPPTPKDILDLCRPQVTIHQRLASPLRIEDNKRHVAELKEGIEKMTAPRRDMRDWARKILANPGNYPDISVRFAKEALSVNTD